MAWPVKGSFVFYIKTDDEIGPTQQVALVTTENGDGTLNLSIFNESGIIQKTNVVYDMNFSKGTWQFC